MDGRTSTRPRPCTRYQAAATPFVSAELARGAGDATVLGSFPTATYLLLPSGSVIGVLTSDAVALPIGLILPTTSADLTLTSLAGQWSISDNALHVYGPVDSMVIEVAQERSVTLAPTGYPVWQRVSEAMRWCTRRIGDTGLAPLSLSDPVRSAPSAPRLVADLLGRGRGLTPAGDDVLCGLLGGIAMFGSEPDNDAALRTAVLAELEERPAATTLVSRQLLMRACAGDGLDEVQALGAAMCDPGGTRLTDTLEAVAAIGHSSGISLAIGVVHAASASPGIVS